MSDLRRLLAPGPWLLVLALLVGTVGLVIVDRRAPAPAGLDSPVESFSAARAMRQLQIMAQEPHHIGQPDHGRVRDFVISELQALGIETHVQAAVVHDETLHNVLGRIPGTDSTGAILLVAHYDSVAKAPGATDNAVSAVAVLETARALVAGPALRNDVIVLIDDAEESSLGGSRAFAAEHPWAADVGFVLNLDGGGHGPSVLAEMHRGSADLVRSYTRVVPRPRASSAMVAIADALQDAGFGGSDFSELRALDKPGIFFAHSIDPGVSHTPADTVERVGLGTVQHHGETLLGLTREYGNRDLSVPPPGSDVVFPGLLTGVTIVWGTGMATGLLALVLLLYAGVVVGVLRRGGRVSGILRGAATALAALVVAPIASIVAVRLVALRPGYGPFFRKLFLDDNVRGLGLPDAELLYWGLLLVPVAVIALLVGRARRRASAAELFAGASMLLALLAVLSTLGLVGASYLFVLPALGLFAGALAWIHLLDEQATGWTTAWVLGLAALPLAMVSAGYFWSLQVFTVGNVAFLAIFVVFLGTPLVLQFEVLAAADRRLPVAATGGLAALLVLVGCVVVAPEPLMAEPAWAGTPSEVRTWEPIAALATSDATVDRMEADTGRMCLTARSSEGERTWCPLPQSVALPLDLQLLPTQAGTLVFGGSPAAASSFLVRHDGGETSVPGVVVPGLTGSMFTVQLPAGTGRIDSIVGLDADGNEVARRGAFEISSD